MKKNYYWLVFVFITLIFGCTRTVIIRADLPRTFPNAQILKEKLDREEALKILYKLNKLGDDRYIGFCNDYHPGGPFEWKSDGLHYIASYTVSTRKDYISQTQTRITSTIQRIPMVLEFQDIQILEVQTSWRKGAYCGIPMRFQKHSKNMSVISLSAFSEEERDQIIAALLTLCSNIK